MSHRESFLARLPVGRVRPPPRPSGPALPPPQDPAGEFLRRLDEGGAAVHRVDGAEAAAARAVEIVRRAGAERAGLAELGPELEGPLRRAAAAAGLELVPAGDGCDPAAVEPLPAGITRAELAVAQTGALVQVARPGGGRLLSLLPPLHVALVCVQDLLPAMEDLAAALVDRSRFPEGPPPAVSLIGGPSKTGDIEAVIVLGVHGPGRLEVVLWG